MTGPALPHSSENSPNQEAKVYFGLLVFINVATLQALALARPT